MNLRTRLRLVICWVAVLLLCAGRWWPEAANAPTPPRPNLIFILADDLGWTDLACYGSDFYETPHLDGLARDGMRFTQAYSACTVCSPTRAALLTGKYPARLHITDWIPGLPPENPNQHYQLGGATPYGAIRVGDFKLIEFFDDMRVELYNLREDVGEQRNLSAQMPEQANELRARLHAWRKEVGAQMPSHNPAYDPSKPEHASAAKRK
ncbi:MAG: sulfatase-like hydrolase/transferase [Verrucomicrobia bacterium]|nr:sulfatase-like hydrolase/transferase [Verrucomicrobiota bacterium]